MLLQLTKAEVDADLLSHCRLSRYFRLSRYPHFRFRCVPRVACRRLLCLGGRPENIKHN